MPTRPLTRPSNKLETFANPSGKRNYRIHMEIPEFTCLCPMTGQPDFATLVLDYVPDKRCVELKSLKLYVWSYRNQGAYHEAVSHASLTLTDMYNVLDALRLGRVLSAKEKVTHSNGLVSVLAELHDRIDTLVLQAYGWADLAPALVGQPGGTLPWPEKPAAQAEAEEELLLRLVALNAERAAEEARSVVRWLRPEFQDPARRSAAAAVPVATQDEMDLDVDDAAPLPAKTKKRAKAAAAAATAKRAWPNTLPEQMRGVAGVLTASARPIGLDVIEANFTGRGPWKRRIPQILEALAALGRARVVNGLWTLG